MSDRHRLSDAELEEIERRAHEDAGEPYRGPLLALVDEVRRLRAVISAVVLEPAATRARRAGATRRPTRRGLRTS